MRGTASVLHLDLDAFFAAVEQRDKPSLRGRPVVVGGLGERGVVATASYEARAYGVRSAMSTREARGRCPHAAYLAPRVAAYRETSRLVMDVLSRQSPLVEPLSLDEAFVDLAAAVSTSDELDLTAVTAIGQRLRREVRAATGGLTASVGIATSKLLAKIASDLDKPDGLHVVPPGTERDLLAPMSVTVIPGVGPATAEQLRRAGVRTVADLAAMDAEELVRQVGRAHGHSLHRLARAIDDRPVQPEREAKSVSVEGTYETDLTDRSLMAGLLVRQAGSVASRLRGQGLSGRTVTIKVRRHDFTTLSRSATLPTPTDRAEVIGRLARRLLEDLTEEVDLTDGVRLLGVGVSGLADWVQEDLFGSAEVSQRSDAETVPEAATHPLPGTGASPGGRPETSPTRRWVPGADVVHAELGPGWVWGSGRGVVTVRFETAATPPGPVRSFAVDDPALRPAPAGPPRPRPAERPG